jgi:cysteine desulfurase family protein (TIGR01976 family)
VVFDVAAVRARYPALADGRAWLDGAAGTQVPECVIDAVAGVYRTGLGNQGAAFPASRHLGELVTGARRAVAELVGAPDPDTVVLGPSMTALTYRFAAALSARWRPGDEVVVTELDHEANLWPWAQAAARVGAVVRTARIDRETGTLPTEEVTGLLTERTRLVAVTAASNLLGTMPDVAAIAGAARRVGALSYVDGVHHCPHAVVDVAALDADVYLTSAYKWYGPHLAAAVTRPGLLGELEPDNLRPVPAGGPVPFELGTNPFPALAGVAAAVRHLADPEHERAAGPAALRRSRAAAVAHEQALAATLLDGLRGIEGVEPLPGWDAPARTATATFRLRGVTPAETAAALAAAGVNVWHGHAYAWAAVGALGLREAGGAVRASLNHYNRADDIHRLLDAVADCASGARASR